ncbi:angiogenic factor with G patch and FHA domains 1-like [Uloborus diversus]|uniref:angiogenic factor with G patch and FHA domains 1-like n=1 Tax=Uloborus diversus TaxID=327109 RepID=UPI002409DE7B|nr:angiogenic factor with G patch and FHA domains 1-like [Uloborus diversus]
MESSSCENCKLLLLELENERKIILKLQANVKALTELLSVEKNEKLYQEHAIPVAETTKEKSKNSESENSSLNENFDSSCDKPENSEVVLKSAQTQTVCDNFCGEEYRDDARKSSGIRENKMADFNEYEVPQSDYVYNEEYKMYYSYSTGYYFDQDKGIFLEPNTGACYKYDYANQQYESVSMDDYMSSYKQLDEASCEDMVEQVNGLNINEKTVPTGLNIQLSEEIISSDDHQSLPMTEECKENTESVGPTSDWQLPEGKNVTVGDLVKEVVEQHYEMSEYVYDESSRMYYSPSTGYYFDPVKQLLYDTLNQISYRYDNEKQSYEYFGKWKSEDPCNAAKSKKQQARKIFWRKKLQKKQSDTEINEDDGKHKHSPEDDFSSPEEGELFSSDSETELHLKDYCPEYEIAQKVFTKAYPPCIRVMVENSETLKVGSLMMVSHMGGVIGRDEDSFLCIPDSGISKMHAEIKYNDELKKYIIKDLGSQNGTFINDKRLSQPKTESEFCAVKHGDHLCLGSCRLLLHIHPGSETCDGCEPGQVLAELSSKEEKSTVVFKTKEEKERERKQELVKLKKKYGLKGMEYSNKNAVVPKGYEDRAGERRQIIGSENPYEKTEEASADVAMSSSNKGYKMLQSMGWKEGQTLGTQNSGILEPIPLKTWTGKAGLGCPEKHSGQSAAASKKSLKWVKAQERYSQVT